MTSVPPPNLSCLTSRDPGQLSRLSSLALRSILGQTAHSSLKLKLCWDNVSEYQYQHPCPLEAGILWLVTFGIRALLLYTDHKGDKGQHQDLHPTSLLQWLFLHPLLPLGRRPPTPAKPASEGHFCLSWGTHHLPIPSTSDMLRVLRNTSLTLLYVIPGRP